ncbi:MAG: phytanoyl-CoA dioxygenase family protein, partial [Chloroflexota bacterium]
QAAGLLEETWANLPFGERLIRIVSQTKLDYSQPLDIALPQSNVTKTTPFHTGPAIFNLLRSPRLLDAVEQFIGPEIYSNPVQHVRIKPPERALPHGYGTNSLVTHTPWHQDMGVIHEEADDSNILTVWLAITEATEENGCMAVVPRSHKDHLALHCPIDGDSVTIPESRIPAKPLPLPMKPGDVLFMTSTTMHTSLRNVSDKIRWSFDLRYNPVGEKTGRPWFPGFVARSQKNPEAELHDVEQWGQLWRDARRTIVEQGIPTFNRWDGNAIGCA